MNNRIAVTPVLFLALTAPLLAQQVSAASATPSVQATGEATVSVKPDQAVIEIGVVTQATTSTAAAADNARQTDAVLADLRRILSTNGQLKTTTYSIRPNYQNPKPGASPAITGYTASNTVEVTLNDLVLVAKVVDGATQSGANLIQSVQYRLKEPRTAHVQALREAAAQAKANAEAIAAGLGMKVQRILSAEEGSGERNYPMPRAMAMSAGAAPATQIEAGMIDLHATVTVRAEIQ